MIENLKLKIENLEKYILYIFLFCVPFQTRIVIRSWGIGFNEWNSVLFYFTDSLLLLPFLFWIFRVKKIQVNKYLVLFLIFSGISILFSLNKDLSIFRFLKLIEFSFLFLYLTTLNVVNKKVFWVLIASGVFQSLIGLFQFIRQGSLGLKILGESPLGLNIPGAATFIDSAGTKFIRAYGTFPHPNLLAVFLFVCIFFLLYLKLSKSDFDSKFFWPIFFALNLGLALTFSRIVILVYLISLIFLFLKYKKIKLIAYSLVLTTLIAVFFSDLLIPRFAFISGQALDLRFFHIKEYFSNLDIQNFIFGVGIGNFVPWLMDARPGLESFMYQPIHNIYLLILAESGIFALIFFLIFLFSVFKNIKFTICHLLFASLLLFGLFDHHFLTLQQGSLLFWLVLGLTSIKAPLKGGWDA